MRVLREQEGEPVVTAIERLRELSRSGREHGWTEDHVELRAAVAGLSPRDRDLALRSFTLHFQLVNLAEQHHRLRRRHRSTRPRETLAEAVSNLRAQGLDEARLDELSEQVSVLLVMTAHPTEAARRTVLGAQVRLADQLQVLDDPWLSDADRDRAHSQIAGDIELLWLTDEVRSTRPSVDDEIRHTLWFFETSMLHAAADVAEAWEREFPDTPLPLRFGSWVGGDRDGNPYVHDEHLAVALGRARQLLLRSYREQARDLTRALGMSSGLAGVSPELQASIERDEAELPWVANEVGERNRMEPYRRKLTAMHRRLDNEIVGRDEPGYACADDFRRRHRADRREPAHPPRHPHRRHQARPAADPGGDLRPAPGPARRARARARPGLRVAAGHPGGDRRDARAVRARGRPPADHLGGRVGRRHRGGGARHRGVRSGGGAAVRIDRRAPGGAGDHGRGCSTTPDSASARCGCSAPSP